MILQLCNLEILEEAYFIEKAGVGYMGKMILLAETTEERMLYGLFAAHDCSGRHFWEEIEINLFRQAAIQTGYALEQAELLQQIQEKRKTAEM